MTVELTAEELDLLFVALGELAIRRAESGEAAGPVMGLLRKIRDQQNVAERNGGGPTKKLLSEQSQ